MKKYLLATICFVFLSCSKNRINIQAGNNIDIKNIKVTLKVYDIENSLSDYIIFKDGVTENIPNVYGENDWKIYYNDSLILKFRHFKTNAGNTHEYNFDLNLENNKLKLFVDIKGDNNKVIEN